MTHSKCHYRIPPPLLLGKPLVSMYGLFPDRISSLCHQGSNREPPKESVLNLIAFQLTSLERCSSQMLRNCQKPKERTGAPDSQTIRQKSAAMAANRRQLKLDVH